ncbi:MAG: right-handed parallel beta-helix repeat-containing protein, partial [Planctomycetota bacterium]
MNKCRVIISTFALVGVTGGAGAGVLYVDDDAPPGGNGRQWSTAYRYLQDALTHIAGSYGAIPEIRVAQGVYTPDRASLHPLLGDRTATFQLVNGVAIKGGYGGLRGPDPDARDIRLYETILSGDLLGNDGLSFLDNEDNSYHVVTGIGADSTAVLEGFTITAGNANGSDWPQFGAWGGGVLNVTGSPTFRRCLIIGNTAEEFGGGMVNFISASPVISQCTFKANEAGSEGGGLGNFYNSNPTISDSRFEGNVGGRGGGIFSQNSQPTVINCAISGNTALSCQVECEAVGAGMYNRSSDATVVNCSFTANVALVYSDDFAVAAGGAMFNEGSAPVITNSTFSGNVAATESEDGYVVTLTGTGGGMFSDAGSAPVVTNSIFWENVGGSFAGALPVVTYSDVQGGFPGAGNISADPMFTDPENGDYRLSPGSPAIDAADNAAVPTDADDVDADGDLLERIPFDLAGDPRFRDDPDTPDTGNADGLDTVVDMGAYEFQYTCQGDLDGSSGVDLIDLQMLLNQFGNAGDPADINGDGVVDILDLIDLLKVF